MAVAGGQFAALRQDADLQKFILCGTPTGKELGSGVYGSAQEVWPVIKDV